MEGIMISRSREMETQVVEELQAREMMRKRSPLMVMVVVVLLLILTNNNKGGDEAHCDKLE